MSKSKRYAKAAGTRVTKNIHDRGYRMWRAGMQVPIIKDKLQVTTDQWNWLRHTGDKKKNMPAYEDMVAEEIVELRMSAMEAARAVGGRRSFKVLDGKMRIAEKANAYIEAILDRAMGTMIENGELVVTEKKVFSILSEEETKLLKSLEKLSDISPIANAFRAIFGDVALHKGLYPERDIAPLEVQGEPLKILQGEEAQRQKFIPAEHQDEIIDDLSKMTPDELKELIGSDSSEYEETHVE